MNMVESYFNNYEPQKLSDIYEKDSSLNNTIKKVKNNYIDIDPSKVIIDRSYQRDDVKVKHIVNNFNSNVYGTVVLIKLNDEYYCVDGQHRIVSAIILGIKTVSAQIIDAKDTKEAADLFLKINQGRRALHNMDIFKGEVKAERPEALAVVDMLSKHNIKISKSAFQNNEVAYLSNIRRKWKTDNRITELSVVSAIKLCAPSPSCADIFKAFFFIGHKYTEDIFNDETINRLIKLGGKDVLLQEINKVKALKGTVIGGTGNDLYNGIALAKLYNTGLRGKQKIEVMP